MNKNKRLIFIAVVMVAMAVLAWLGVDLSSFKPLLTIVVDSGLLS